MTELIDIMLPETIKNTLVRLTGLENETNGALLYLRKLDSNSKKFLIDALYMTGSGTSGHVKAEETRMNVVNTFLNQNEAYDYIKFHTHTINTIRKHGPNHAYDFSAGDYIAITNQSIRKPNFIALLATPKRFIIRPEGLYNFKFVNVNTAYKLRMDNVKAQLKLLSQSLPNLKNSKA